MNKRDHVSIEIPGKHFLCIEPAYLPPVGTRIQLHKHLYDGGTTLLLEIIEHDWCLEDDTTDLDGNPQSPTFSIRLRTRIVES